MIMPVSQPTSRKALCRGAEVFRVLKKILSDHGMSTIVDDEAGFAPNFGRNDEWLSTILPAIEKAGCRTGEAYIWSRRSGGGGRPQSPRRHGPRACSPASERHRHVVVR